MILQKKANSFLGFDDETMANASQLISLVEKRNTFKEELIELFDVDESETIKVRNAVPLINAINELDAQSEKIDIDVAIKDIYLKKLPKHENATFEVFNVEDETLRNHIGSDKLIAEAVYSSKLDILNIYDFNKFAEYCRGKGYNDLIETINEYLLEKNAHNPDHKRLRLLYRKLDDKYFIRALTSKDYKDYGINFSTFVALKVLSDFSKRSGYEVYVSEYVVGDSHLYISFALDKEFIVNDDINLVFELTLENDEIKRRSVAFNGLFKLIYSHGPNKSEIYLKPKGIRQKDKNQPVDLLTYNHRGKVDNVLEQIKDLPKLIEQFIEQAKADSIRVSRIQHPDEVRKFINYKIKKAHKTEFFKYKEQISKKLMAISVDTVFQLFELLREVEELFEHEDIVSKNYWRTRLYETLIQKQ